MIQPDDDVGDAGLEEDGGGFLIDNPFLDGAYDDLALAGDGAGAGMTAATGPVVGARRRASARGRVGDGWVVALLLAGAVIGAAGALVALGAGSAWGVIVNGAAGALCLLAAAVERWVDAVAPVGTRAMRVGHYARLLLVGVVIAAVIRFGAEDGGMDAVAWYVPTAMASAAVVVQWWRDPQRMT